MVAPPHHLQSRPQRIVVLPAAQVAHDFAIPVDQERGGNGAHAVQAMRLAPESSRTGNVKPAFSAKPVAEVCRRGALETGGSGTIADALLRGLLRL